METQGRIWVALDTQKEKALEIAERVAKLTAVGGFKVNRLIDQEVFRRDGEKRLFRELAQYKKPIWADTKFIDIPRTVAARTEPYVLSGMVQYITVMAKGGIPMMRDAVKAAGQAIDVIAVTELTSLTEEEVHLLSGLPSKASVINLARSAVLAGVKYLVCSGQELPVLKKHPELEPLRMFVPAIRPEWSQVDTPDQKRVMTPVEALRLGAKMVVIGSPIVKAENPVDAVKKTAEEIVLAKD